MVGSQAWSMAVFMFMFGLVMPGVDNAAHAGGFAGGYLAGRLLDPLKPERIDHMIARRRVPRLCRCCPSWPRWCTACCWIVLR